MNTMQIPKDQAVDTLRKLEMQFLAALDGVRQVLRALSLDPICEGNYSPNSKEVREMKAYFSGPQKKKGRPPGSKNSTQPADKMERNKEILAMYDAGLSTARIADEFGISLTNVYTIVKKMKAASQIATAAEPETQQQ